MSRSGYDEYDDSDNANWNMIKWRGMVASATRGKRGQALFKDILIGLNGMSVKQLIKGDLVAADGAVCALGAAGKLRRIDMYDLDPEDSESVAGKFDIADCLAREVVYENDDGEWRETPEQRFERMRKWVRSQIKDPLFDVVWC